MRKLRVTSSMLRLVSDMRDHRGGMRKGGVLLVPPILDPDEWERRAVAQQAQLMAASDEDRTSESRDPQVDQGHSDAVAEAQRQQAGHREAHRLERERERVGNTDYLRQKEAKLRGAVR